MKAKLLVGKEDIIRSASSKKDKGDKRCALESREVTRRECSWMGLSMSVKEREEALSGSATRLGRNRAGWMLRLR